MNTPSPTARQLFWQFFLWVAFPIHAWAIVIWLMNADGLAARALSEAFGLGGYLLLGALAESVLVFGIFAGLGLLLPRRWPLAQRVDALRGLLLTATFWALALQASIAFVIRQPERHAAWVQSLNANWGPLLLLLTLVLLSAGLPIWAATRPGWRRILATLQERVSLFSILYLGLDAIGILIILFRNL